MAEMVVVERVAVAHRGAVVMVGGATEEGTLVGQPVAAAMAAEVCTTLMSTRDRNRNRRQVRSIC